MTKQEIVYHFNPIGSGYITTSDTDDPNVNLGGVWEKIPGNYFININTGDLVVNDGDNYTSSAYTGYSSSTILSEAQNARHTHLIPCLTNGVYSTKQLVIYTNCEKYDSKTAQTAGDSRFKLGGISGVAHDHLINHSHTYDPIHINVYLWKRIG